MSNRFWNWLWSKLMILALLLMVMASVGWVISPAKVIGPEPEPVEQAEPAAPARDAGPVVAPVDEFATAPRDFAPDRSVPASLLIVGGLVIAVGLLALGARVGRPDGPLERHKADRRELVELRAQRARGRAAGQAAAGASRLDRRWRRGEQAFRRKSHPPQQQLNASTA